jgi:hypothetical protein
MSAEALLDVRGLQQRLGHEGGDALVTRRRDGLDR